MCYGVCIGENNLSKGLKSQFDVQINGKAIFLRFILT